MKIAMPPAMLRLCAGAAVATGLLSTDAFARPDVLWASPINGLWSDAANWNPTVIPSAGDNAIFGFAMPYTVTLGSMQAVGNLLITNPAVTMNLPGPTTNTTPSTFQIHAGSLQNEGLIRIMFGTGTARAQLMFMANTAIVGGGEIRLEEALNARFDATDYVVTQHAAHTVAGTGVITAASGRLINHGRIEANVAGKVLAVDKVTNHGLMRALNGATLTLADVTQAPEGIIGAENGTITILGAVGGGTIDAATGSAITIPGMNASVQNITAMGEWRIQGGFSTTAQLVVHPGAFTNDADIRVMSSGGTALKFEPGVIFAGSGSVSLEHSTKAALTLGSTMTHVASHVIHGQGQISAASGAELVNQGLIAADVSGGTLAIACPVTNGGILQASNGGTLRVNQVMQEPGGVVLVNGGLLTVDGVIDGGTVRAVNVPLRFTTPNTSVNGVRAQGEWLLVGGSGNPALNVGAEGLVNDGLIRAPGIVNLAPNVVLSGSGQLHLAIGTISGAASGKALNAQGHTIQGTGAIQNLINRGDIFAGTTSSPLSFTGVHNESRIAAINYGVIVLNSVTQSPDAVIELQGGLLRVQEMNLAGGSVRCLPGTLAQGSNAKAPGRLDDVAFEGDMQLLPPAEASASHYLELGAGGMRNNGRIRIDSDTSKGTIGITAAPATTTVIDGVGEIVLGGNKAKSVIVARSGAKLTLGSGQTVTGVGSVYAETGGTLVNRGLIQNPPGQALSVNEVENEGVIHANSGMEFRRIRQSDSGRIHFSTGVLNTNGVHVTGGSITADQDLQILSGTFGAVSNHANWLVKGVTTKQNVRLYLEGGTFENHGTIRFVPFDNLGTYSAFDMKASATLAGTGEMVFESVDQAGILVWTGRELTNQVGHTIRGIGEFDGAGFFFNHGILKPGLPYGMMTAKAKTTLEPTSVLEMEFAGSDSTQRDLLRAVGAMKLGGTLRVIFNDGYQLPPCGEHAFVTGPCTGTFTNLELPTMPAGKLRVRYDANAVVLTYQPADHDASGFVDTDDFTAFMTDFEAGADAADFDNSGFVDTDDFTAFIYAFEAGC